jgi:hypothetical protein
MRLCRLIFTLSAHSLAIVPPRRDDPLASGGLQLVTNHLSPGVASAAADALQLRQRTTTYPGGVGRGCGVGRSLGNGVGLGVTVGVGVGVGVTIGVGVGVTVGVGVGVTIGVAVAVGLGVGVG